MFCSNTFELGFFVNGFQMKTLVSFMGQSLLFNAKDLQFDGGNVVRVWFPFHSHQKTHGKDI
jgi:hypothetical protein